MSYEGRIQSICQNGHYMEQEAPYGGAPGRKCSCGAPDAWKNGVDDTNGDAVGYIHMGFFQVNPAEMHTCSCGHIHILKEAIFRIPTPEETRLAQTMRIWQEGEHVLVYEHDKSPFRV